MTPTTPITRAQLQDHLHSLEERLFHPDRAPDRAALFALLASDFREFCTSGRVRNRQQVIDLMSDATPRPATLHHYFVVPLSETSALATYRATTPSEISHRSSIWTLREGQWQLLFHHGTTAS
jgi:hypothetical protein